jgi:hypothetical protein
MKIVMKDKYLLHRSLDPIEDNDLLHRSNEIIYDEDLLHRDDDVNEIIKEIEEEK